MKFVVEQILASGAQIKALSNYPKDTPVVMLNMLKFKDKTGRGTESGAEAYARYARNVYPLLEKAGARIIWSGDVVQTVIGQTEGQPDRILLVEYPSVQKFIEMATSEAYYPIGKDREIALEYGGLLACKADGDKGQVL